jgi:serine/threonine protein kinase
MTTSDRPVFNDRYEIHSRIGRGGMADVFLARDRLLDRPVAVKVLFPEYATDPNFVERFRREATAASNLNHPNIVGVFDFGRQGGTYYMVMEYVNGRTVADILRSDGSLLPQRAADIASDVAAALGFAHRNGVVHRDVKPANILVSSTGAEGGRLRHRPGHERRRSRPHPGRRGDGDSHLLLARAGPGRQPRSPQRPLQPRHRHVRDGRRPAAVPGRQPGSHRLQAGARRRRRSRPTPRPCRRPTRPS